MTVSCFLMGGLGNQLFQIFAILAYSLRHNVNFYFPVKVDYGSTVRHSYWNTFLRFIKDKVKDTHIKGIFFSESNFTYNPLPIIKGNVIFRGYFQSEKYFKDQYSNVCKLLRLEDLISELNISDHAILNNSLAIHFRLGDYKQLQDYHPILTLDYYSEGIKEILKHDPEIKTIIYFCETESVIEVQEKFISFLQSTYPELTFLYFNDLYLLEDWQELLCMSMCKHFIIANSSFSWWSAYLSNSITKKVIMPKKWFGDSAKLSDKDLQCENWIKL